MIVDFNLCTVCVDVYSCVIQYGLVPDVPKSSGISSRQQLCAGLYMEAIIIPIIKSYNIFRCKALNIALFTEPDGCVVPQQHCAETRQTIKCFKF
jgi:hypothetical protein